MERDLDFIKNMVAAKVYHAVTDIAKREQQSGDYRGDGHDFAQRISAGCAHGFLLYLPILLERVGQIISKSLPPENLKEWLQGYAHINIFIIVSRDSLYKGDPETLTKEMAARVSKYILPIMPTILREIAEVFFEKN